MALFDLSSANARSSCWGAILLVAGAAGCLSQSYEISSPELERLVALPAEERGERVRVTQQTSFGSDVGDVSRLSSDDDDFALMLAVSSSGQHHHHHRRDHRSHRRAHVEWDADDAGDDDGDDGDLAERALVTTVVVVAAAATAAVTAGITEGARFDGWMAAPPRHPVLLIDDAGGRQWTRLEELTPSDLNGVDRAVLPDLAGDLEQLARHPLDRQGFVYQLEFGAESATLSDPGLAVSGRGALGYMPGQRYGVLVGGAFATARGLDTSGIGPAPSELMMDYRTYLQVEFWPLAAGRVHAGPYVELGYAWALRDDALGSQRADGPMAALGAALQLDVSTRLALTLRLGAAWVPSVDVTVAGLSNGYRLSPALTLGVSIY